jgi:hypothetical protein
LPIFVSLDIDANVGVELAYEVEHVMEIRANDFMLANAGRQRIRVAERRFAYTTMVLCILLANGQQAMKWRSLDHRETH